MRTLTRRQTLLTLRAVNRELSRSRRILARRPEARIHSLESEHVREYATIKATLETHLRRLATPAPDRTALRDHIARVTAASVAALRREQCPA